MNNDISIVLTVYNQQNIIYENLKSIVDNSSELVKEIIIVIDGCTDNSEKEIDKVKCNIPIIKIYTPNVNEVIANNFGLRICKYNYSIIFQDDMRINEKNFDKRMLKPFSVIPNLFALTARDGVDGYINGNEIKFTNTAGKDVNTPRNIFSKRLMLNRGPIIFDNEKLRQLNYLDEIFAPIGLDDVEICLRANEMGWVTGSYVIDYTSEKMWGTTRKSWASADLLDRNEKRNMKIIIERHRYILNNPPKSENIDIGE